MTVPVDVLAAIDEAIVGIHGEGYECRDLENARAAIAELIAADAEYDAAEAEYIAHDRPLLKRDKLWYAEWERMGARCDAAIARRAAALVAVGGAG